MRGCSPGVGIPVGAQHPARGWVGAGRTPSCPAGPLGAAQPGHPPWPTEQGARGAGVPRGTLGVLRWECLLLIKTLPVILLWLAAPPALPA